MNVDKLYERLLARLQRQGMNEAFRHFGQAESALSRSEWESANAQTRSGLESIFNQVAAIRLKTDKKGGEARQALETAGLLRGREARLVQEFMAVAGGTGSHAGVSNFDEAVGRFLTGLGIAHLALALIPELVRVEDVVVGQLKAPAGATLPTDKEMNTVCPTCGTKQTLDQASISRVGPETVYTCTNGCHPIVVVGTPESIPWKGRGYRLGDHVIRNAGDLFLPLRGSAGVVIPASPAALMKERPHGS
jgi:hypothetical protein